MNTSENSNAPFSFQKREDTLVTTLGVIGLVLAILTFILAFVPCVGAFAFYIGLLAMLLSGIGLYLAFQRKVNKGLLIAALIVSIVGSFFSYLQFALITSANKIMIDERHIERTLPSDDWDDDYDD